MSAVTAEAFTSDNKPYKRRKSQTFADLIHGELPGGGYRVRGIPVVSCTGPNINAHLDEYRCILGEQGTLYVAENNKSVFDIIKNALGKNNTKVKLFFGDVFDVINKYLPKQTRRVYLDLDFCRTFGELKREGLLDSISTLSECTFDMYQVWITFTFTERNDPFRTGDTKQDRKNIVKEIQNAWGDNLECVSCQSYRDVNGPPMITILFRCVW